MNIANILTQDGRVIEKIGKQPIHINVFQVLFTILKDYSITNVVPDESAKDPNFRFKAKMKGKPIIIVIAGGSIKKTDDVLNKLKNEFPDRKLTIENNECDNKMDAKMLEKYLKEDLSSMEKINDDLEDALIEYMKASEKINMGLRLKGQDLINKLANMSKAGSTSTDAFVEFKKNTIVKMDQLTNKLDKDIDRIIDIFIKSK